MNEAALWKCLSKAIGGRWEAQRHEDKHSTGIPDVSYATDHHGWVELKSIDVKDESKPIRIKHFTATQRAWAKRFGSKCGHVWVFIRVNRYFMLFSWTSVDRIGMLNLKDMLAECHAHWLDKVNPEEFIKSLGVEHSNRVTY